MTRLDAGAGTRTAMPMPLPLPARSGRRRLRRLGLLRDRPAAPERLRWTDRSPAIVLPAVAVGAATVGWLLAGPVAAAAVGTYAPVAVHAWRRHRARLTEERALGQALDAVTMLAADLRAGTAPAVALTASMPAVEPGSRYGSVSRVEARLRAALRVADSLGAPLADVCDRLDGDLRAMRRAAALARAHAAGAQATTLLLAALPVAGIALGYSIGADPLKVLLHTTLGAACLAAAMALHLAGLYWSERLARSVGEPR